MQDYQSSNVNLKGKSAFDQSIYFYIESFFGIQKMLTKKLSQCFANMLMFHGKLTCSPNTLNNEVHTFFLANWWQDQHQKYLDNPKKVDEFSYANWIKLINNVSKFNREYCQAYNQLYTDPKAHINIMDFRAFRLFHDWDVWGDSTSFADFKCTAYFDGKTVPQKKGDFNRLIKNVKDKNNNEEFPLTSKLGMDKSVIANLDTDQQDQWKLYSFKMSINNEAQIKMKPAVSRDLYRRTVDMTPWSPSLAVDWFGNGQFNYNPDEVKYNNPFLTTQKWKWNQNLMIRMMQYRFNHPAKVSPVAGYLMNPSDKPTPVNNHWRIVKVQGCYKNPNLAEKHLNTSTNDSTKIDVYLRNIQFKDGDQNKNGIMLDLSGAVMDANTKEYLPVLPHCMEVKVKSTTGKASCFSIPKENMKKFFYEQSGIYVIEDQILPANEDIQVDVCLKIKSQMFCSEVAVDLQGKQTQISLEFQDRFLKTQTLDGIAALTPDEKLTSSLGFKKYIEYQLYATKFGKPFQGQADIFLQSNFNVDPSGLTQFTSDKNYINYIDSSQVIEKYPQHEMSGDPIERLTIFLKKLSCQQNPSEKIRQFQAKYSNVEDVQSKVFDGKLKDIIKLTDRHVQKMFPFKLQKPKQNPTQSQIDDLKKLIKDMKISYYCKNDPSQQFQLVFKDDDGQNISKTKDITFKQGKASIKVYLNHDLLEDNNPRSPALDSLCITGSLVVKSKDGVQMCKKSNFSGIYYQNLNKNPYEDIDWVHTVGPQLKMMGLIYPAMQKIVNLYNYSAVSMNAMKRAFEVEDQNHPRYMPATRQMSAITHRQIRRWLYYPTFDSLIDNIKPEHSKGQEKIKCGPKELYPFYCGKCTPPSQNSSSQKLQQQEKKQNPKQLLALLRQSLKNAFLIQLTTIPLYLSAMFSIEKQCEAKSQIRKVSTDEMKHLFIVSNILNAIGQNPPYPKKDQGQPIKNDFIPDFPMCKIPGLFHFNLQCNEYYKNLMTGMPIQICSEQQLMRFIMIEMPGQAYKIRPHLNVPNPFYFKDIKQQKKQRALNMKKKIQLCNKSFKNLSKLQQDSVEQDLLNENINVENFCLIFQDVKNQSVQKYLDHEIARVAGISLENKSQQDKQKYRKAYNQRYQRVKKIKQAICAVSKQYQYNKKGDMKQKTKFKTIGAAYEDIMNLFWRIYDAKIDQGRTPAQAQDFMFKDQNERQYKQRKGIAEKTQSNTNDHQINTDKQFTYMYLDNMTPVINLRTALEQMRLIVEQGEAASIFSLTGQINKESHFVKFMEVYTGSQVQIKSQVDENGQRNAWYMFTPDYVKFDNFPDYVQNLKFSEDTKSQQTGWNDKSDKKVNDLISEEWKLQRFSDNLKFTKFPDSYAPASFKNAYLKIMQELGIIFTTDPKSFENEVEFKRKRLTAMENSIAKMRQMTMHAWHIIKPNDTYDRPDKIYPSTRPQYDIAVGTKPAQECQKKKEK